MATAVSSNIKGQGPQRKDNNILLAQQKRFNFSHAQKLNPGERELFDRADLQVLQAAMREMLVSGSSAQAQHAESKSSLKTFGNKSAEFAEKMSSHLQSFSGILEIMKSGDGMGYGMAAYQAFSLLLIVGVNKRRKESIINRTLHSLQGEYSRIGIIADVHVTANMEKYIRQAVLLSIEFLQKAVEYYERPSWKRVLEAITHPSAVWLDGAVADIKTATAEIEKERDTLNSQSLHNVKMLAEKNRQDAERTQAQLTKLEERVSDQDERTRKERLKSYREISKVAQKDAKKELDQNLETLEECFKHHGGLRAFQKAELEGDSSYRAWLEAEESEMLLLYGKTRVPVGDYCWLSPAIQSVYQQLTSANGSGVATYLCRQPVGGREIGARNIIDNTVYQLIEGMNSIVI